MVNYQLVNLSATISNGDNIPLGIANYNVQVVSNSRVDGCSIQVVTKIIGFCRSGMRNGVYRITVLFVQVNNVVFIETGKNIVVGFAVEFFKVGGFFASQGSSYHAVELVEVAYGNLAVGVYHHLLFVVFGISHVGAKQAVQFGRGRSGVKVLGLVPLSVAQGSTRGTGG